MFKEGQRLKGFSGGTQKSNRIGIAIVGNQIVVYVYNGYRTVMDRLNGIAAGQFEKWEIRRLRHYFL